MAARYAVTTGNWTGAIWAATSGGAAGSAAVPTSADDATVNQDVVVTLDATTCVANSVTLSARSTGTNGGKLQPSQTANSKLIVEQGIVVAGGDGVVAARSGFLNLDMSAVPQYTCEVYCNNVRATGAGYGITLNGNFLLKGAPKNAYGYISGAIAVSDTTFTVDNASGWRQGDRLIFATTQAYNATPKTDNLLLDATYTNGSTSLVTSTGAVNTHDAKCLVGNFTRNVKIGPATAGDVFFVYVSVSASKAADGRIRDVEFVSPYKTSGYPSGVVQSVGSGNTGFRELSNCAVYDWDGAFLICANSWGTQVTRDNNQYYTARTAGGATIFNPGGNTFALGEEVSPCVYRSYYGYAGIAPYSPLRNPKISGVTYPNPNVTSAIDNNNVGGILAYGGGIWSCNSPVNSPQNAAGAEGRFIGTRFGCGPDAAASYPNAKNAYVCAVTGGASIIFDSCVNNVSGISAISSMANGAYSPSNGLLNTSVTFINKGTDPAGSADPAVQEVYEFMSDTVPVKARETDALTITNSTSSLRMKWTGTSGNQIARSFDVLTKSGTPITLITYIRKSALAPAYGSSTLPSITVSGLGITPVTSTYVDVSTSGVNLSAAGNTYTRATGSFTTDGYAVGDRVYVEGFANAANNGTKLVIAVGTTTMDVAEALTVESAGAGRAISRWYKSVLTATQNSGADGLLTVTLTGQSAVSGATCHFSGLPMSPFITRARHYGYLFDETLPTRTANAFVSASEAVARGYTGFSVTGGASVSPVTVSADNTFQKLYDYTQAWACASAANVGYAVPVTAAAAGSFVAQANVTVNAGFKLNGSGSLAMGAYTLSTEFAGGSAYTYTGGTWSQATTVPTFAGGTANLGAAGTYMFGTSGNTILSMTPAAASTYNMAAVTATGTLDLRNTTAFAITVELASGTSYTTANNTGGAITVTLPATYQSVTVSGAVAGSRIQIYDTSAATELYNGTPAFPFTWTDPAPAAAARPIRLRVAKVSGATAKEFIEANIGTCATSGTGKDLSYLVSQVDDATYNTNAIDGSTVTGITITPSPARVTIGLVGGSVTWPQIYAYQVYWLGTATGIADEAAFIYSPDTANYIVTGFVIKNTNPTVGLKITGGWGRDSVTGSSIDLWDSSGGSIGFQGDHAIPYSAGSGLTAGQAAQLSAVEAATADIPTDVWSKVLPL